MAINTEMTMDQKNVTAFAQTLTDPWWNLVGAEANAASAYAKDVVNSIYNNALSEINQLQSKALTDAQKYEKLARLWGDLSTALKADAIGLSSHLTDTQKVWADKAIQALDKAIAVGELVKANPGMLLKDLVSAVGNQLGGLAAAAQLVSELGKDAEKGGPNYNDIGKAALGIGVGIIATLLLPMTVPGIAIALGMGFAADYLWNRYAREILGDRIDAPFWDTFFDFWIGDSTNSGFSAAQRFIPRRDPLTLDLNANGLETVGINATHPIYFDLTGNGVQTSVGWVAPNDGFLVLDRNGDGVINDGTELFGDATPLLDADGNVIGKAADGFEALAAQDTNGDGVVNNLDANFSNLRVWQDLNQDGISQSNELKTLAELNIASFNVANVNHNQLLANGNQIADTGTYTKTDGSTGTAGVTAGMADVNLAVDTFHRTFADIIPTTAQTETLPDMQGSGVVRDLREAASIQTPEGALLASTLATFAATTTRDGQRGMLDTLVAGWGATSGFEDMQAQAIAHGYTFTTNLDAVHQARLYALEAFNGRDFYRMPWETLNAQSGVTGMSVTHDASGDHIRISMNGTQLSLLDQAYSALKESVYDALIPQTRLKPYLDDISLALDANGNFSLDFSTLDTLLNTTHTNNLNTFYSEAANDEVSEIRSRG